FADKAWAKNYPGLFKRFDEFRSPWKWLAKIAVVFLIVLWVFFGIALSAALAWGAGLILRELSASPVDWAKVFWSFFVVSAEICIPWLGSLWMAAFLNGLSSARTYRMRFKWLIGLEFAAILVCVLKVGTGPASDAATFFTLIILLVPVAGLGLVDL